MLSSNWFGVSREGVLQSLVWSEVGYMVTHCWNMPVNTAEEVKVKDFFPFTYMGKERSVTLWMHFLGVQTTQNDYK